MNLWINLISWFKDPDKLFYPGQEITPKVKPIWWNEETKKDGIGPKFGEIVRVEYYKTFSRGRWYIKVSGYDDCYNETVFAPVISDDELEDMLNEIDELTLKRHEI